VEMGTYQQAFFRAVDSAWLLNALEASKQRGGGRRTGPVPPISGSMQDRYRVEMGRNFNRGSTTYEQPSRPTRVGPPAKRHDLSKPPSRGERTKGRMGPDAVLPDVLNPHGKGGKATPR